VHTDRRQIVVDRADYGNVGVSHNPIGAAATTAKEHTGDFLGLNSCLVNSASVLSTVLLVAFAKCSEVFSPITYYTTTSSLPCQQFYCLQMKEWFHSDFAPDLSLEQTHVGPPGHHAGVDSGAVYGREW